MGSDELAQQMGSDELELNKWGQMNLNCEKWVQVHLTPDFFCKT